MDRFLEGLQSASKPAPTPRPLLSCQSSHQAKASGGFLLQTLPDIPYSSFQKHPVRKTGTVFPRWHRKAYLSPLPSIAGEGREGREGRCQTEISKKKEIKEFPQTRRSIRIQAATDFFLLSVFVEGSSPFDASTDLPVVRSKSGLLLTFFDILSILLVEAGKLDFSVALCGIDPAFFLLPPS